MPKHRTFVEGGCCRRSQPFLENEKEATEPLPGMFIPGNMELNTRVARLHAQLQTDEVGAMIRINAHLPCVALKDQYAERVVLLPEDAPQLGTLPDLGYVIRKALATRRWGDTYITALFLQCLPGQRCVNSMALTSVDHASASAALNLLLGTLLGVYPSALKPPPFATRAKLYARVHCLLTLDSVRKEAFLVSHPWLFVLAMQEYMMHMLRHYMPAEAQALDELYPMHTLAVHVPLILDLFRQNHLDTGSENWETLDVAAHEAHERIVRVSKAKPQGGGGGKLQQALWAEKSHRRAGKANTEDVAAALQAHLLRPYACHAADKMSLRTEYALMMQAVLETKEESRVNTAHIAELHSSITVHSLPSNIRQMQESLVSMGKLSCEHQARLKVTKHLCLMCEQKRRRTVLRLCSRTGDMVCPNCNDSSQHVVGLCMIGRVLCMHGMQYYMALCCGTVQAYELEGSEYDLFPSWIRSRHHLPEVDPDAAPCRHVRNCQTERRKKRVRCALCDSNALQHGHTYLNHLTARMATMFLCQRHTPGGECLRYVMNMRQFEHACYAWEKRARHSGRR